MKGTILLFGFEDLPSIAAAGGVAERFGAQLRPVMRSEYNTALGVLAGVSKSRGTALPYAGGPLGGRMMVFCGLEKQLDDILAAVRQAGIGPECLKAVLTANNQNWNAVTLYGELWSEHQAMRGKR